MSVARIYEHVAAAGEPLKLPSPWQTLSADPDFFRLAPSPDALREELLTRFDVPSLIESGMFVRTKEGGAVAEPRVFTPNAVLWALRPAPGAAPFQLIADQRGVRQAEWSFAAIMRAHETEVLIGDMPDRIAITFSMIDLAILRTLKIPAVPGVGLQHLKGNRFEIFRRLLRLQNKTPQLPSTSPRTDGRASADNSRSLILHDWSLERFGFHETSQGRELWAYLKKFSECFGLNLGNCEYVRPTSAELATLRFLVEHERWNEVRNAIIDGPYAESRSLLLESLKPEVPPSLASLMERWMGALSHKPGSGDKRKAWQDLLGAYEREIFQPLAAEAQRTGDPAERNLLTALAGMSRLLHPQTLLLAEKFGQAIGDKGSAWLATNNTEEFQHLFATADRVLALSNGVQACRKQTRSPKIALPARTRQSKCLNGSASESPTSRP